MSRLFFVAKVGGFQEKTRKRACSWRIRGLKISLVSCHVSVGSLSSLPLARESREASKFVGHGVKGEIRQHGAEGFPGRHVTPFRVTSFFPPARPISARAPRKTGNQLTAAFPHATALALSRRRLAHPPGSAPARAPNARSELTGGAGPGACRHRCRGQACRSWDRQRMASSSGRAYCTAHGVGVR